MKQEVASTWHKYLFSTGGPFYLNQRRGSRCPFGRRHRCSYHCPDAANKIYGNETHLCCSPLFFLLTKAWADVIVEHSEFHQLDATSTTSSVLHWIQDKIPFRLSWKIAPEADVMH
jgi:hypothetical protein